MIKFFSKHKNFIFSFFLICLISFLGIFVFKVNTARADFVDFTFTVIAGIIAKLGEIFRSIASLAFWAASMLLELAFGLEGFTNAGIVVTGWRLTRDLVNMFFVLVLLVIAFSTILRIEEYGMKRILWKLVAMALLINFSLVICGAIIDFAQVTTHFFYDEAKSGYGIAAQISDVFEIQKAYEVSDIKETGDKIEAGVGGLIMITFSVLFGTLLILAATIAVALGAFFLITRLIWLWILLIMAPLAWFAWILPGTASYAKDWWNRFLKWTFFAPIYAFFVWLAILTAQGGSFVNIIKPETAALVENTGWASVVGVALAAPQLLLQFLCIVGILIGGLMAADKVGAYGASGAMSLTKSAGEGTVNWIGRRARTTTMPLAAKISGALQGQAARRGRILGGIAGQAAKPFRAYEETERAAVGQAEKKYDNWTNDNLKSQYKTAVLTDKVAIAKILAKRGDLAAKDELGFTETNIEKSLNLAKRYGVHKDILKSRPDLSKTVGEDPREIIKKMKQKDMELIQSISLGTIDATGTVQQSDAQKEITNIIGDQLKRGGPWKAGHISKMAEMNPSSFEIVAKKILGPEKEMLQKSIKEYLDSDIGKAVTGDLMGRGIITSPTQEEFLRAKAEGYRGK